MESGDSGDGNRIDFAIDCFNISTNFYRDISNVTNYILGVFKSDVNFSNLKSAGKLMHIGLSA